MSTPEFTLKRIHAQRLREVYRSAGWPYQDMVEVELLAAGLLQRITNGSGHELVRVTDAGLNRMVSATQQNRQARSAHETLLDKVVESMQREGRLVWTGLNLRARLTGESEDESRWKMCQPDVFSIRNSPLPDYLEPVVHEIKVSRADLLGDLKRVEKRGAYLDVGGNAGTCWAAVRRAIRLLSRRKFRSNAASCCVWMANWMWFGRNPSDHAGSCRLGCVSVINQIEGPIITLRDGRNQANIAADLW